MVKRELIELAIETGKSLQSEKTKFLHYTYHTEKSDHYDTIPTYENFLFVLALFKSRKSDNIQEAKLLLDRLLSYQVLSPENVGGNFPIYLHEFPTCYSRRQGVKLLIPLCWILKKFHHILGAELRSKAKNCLNTLVNYCLNTLEEHPADYLTNLRTASGVFSAGGILENDMFEKEGSARLDDLKQLGSQSIWFTREGIANILSSLQLVYENISDSPWNMFWDHVRKFWHPTLRSYCGPAIDEWQRGKAPEPSLYDFYLSSFSQDLPERIMEKHLCHLETVLINPGEDIFQESKDTIAIDDKLEESHWCVKSEGHYSYSAIELHEKRDPQHVKGFHPFYLQWKDGEKHYSLVCAGGHINKMSYQVKDNEIHLFFVMPEPVTSDHPLENRELLFYYTAHDDVKINVEGTPATTFKLGETVNVVSKQGISLKFELEDGEGEFLGHLMPGDRPSQRLVSKRRPTEANDWQIFLRTIRKKSPCTIHVTLKMQ